MRMLPRRTWKSSSSWSCLCQTNSPWSLATLMYWSLTWPMTLGDQRSVSAVAGLEEIDGGDHRESSSANVCADGEELGREG